MSHDAAEEPVMLDPAEAGEEIPQDDDEPMDSDDDADYNEQQGQELEIQLQNDSIAHFDAHGGNSIFCIAQHPTKPNIIATGGGEDEESKEVGLGFIFDVEQGQAQANQVVNASGEREGIRASATIKGHTDSIAAVTFSLPRGNFAVTGGLDGRLIAHRAVEKGGSLQWSHHATAQEVEEINWLAACPHPDYENTIALGASDGSVWVYTISAAGGDDLLAIVQTYYVHTGSCTAGAWTPDGNFLATVSEDGSLYVWDVWGAGAAGGLASTGGASAQAVVALTALDERFKVDGGLYSVAVAPSGNLLAVGGADGQVRVVGLPRLGGGTGQQAAVAGKTGKGGAGAKSKPSAGGSGSGGQAGAILASLESQSGSIETLDFSIGAGGGAGSLLLASGSVDGSIVVFDAGRNFAVRRKIAPITSQASRGDAQEDDNGDGEGEAIVKVEFVRGAGEGWLLTSAGYDGVLRRWDLRGGQSQTAGTAGLVGEWKGHRGGGDGGGIMGFVQGGDGGSKVVTAGDDGVALLFDMNAVPQAG